MKQGSSSVTNNCECGMFNFIRIGICSLLKKLITIRASDVNAYNDQSKKLEKLEGENEELKRRIGEHEEDLVNLS